MRKPIMGDIMYCPRCSTKTSVDQRFCRSCGMTMDGISQMLADQQSFPGRPAPDRAEVAIREFRGRQLRRKLVILSPLVVLLAIVLLGFNMPESSLPIAILIGVILGRYTSSLRSPFRRHINKSTAPLLHESSPNQISSASYEWMPSITEHTTRTLEPSVQTKA
jgi:hypothetical protein